MDDKPRLPAYSWILYAVAAAFLFPPFLPTPYLLPLFSIRLIGSGLLIYLAVRAFKAAHSVEALPSPELRIAAHPLTAAVAVVAGLYMAYAGDDLAAPDDDGIAHLVTASLTRQGPGLAADYSDLKVAATKCYSRRTKWDCTFSASYRASADGPEYVEPYNSIEVSKASGERVNDDDKGCEFRFQWSARIRQSPYYTPDLEPVGLGYCQYHAQGRYFSNQIWDAKGRELKTGDRKSGLTFKVFADNPGETVLDVPDPDSARDLIRAAMDGEIEKIDCEDATARPGATTVSCSVSGTRVVWQDDSLAAVGMDMQVKGKFSRRVTLAPEGLRWVVGK